MNSSMYTGITGLLADQKALDVTSNNVANVNTTGFKSDRVSFADLMYSDNGIGMGTSVMTIDKDFSQGTLKQTSNPYDFAIKGEGFFTVSSPTNPTEIMYTRAGDFRMGVDGFLQNPDEMQVMGIAPLHAGPKIELPYTNHIASSTYEDNLTVSSTNVFSTDYNVTAKETGVSGANLKSADSNTTDIDLLISAYNIALKNGSQEVTVGLQDSSVDYGATLVEDDNISLKINGLSYSQSYDTSVENTLNSFSDKLSSIPGITTSVDITTGMLTISSLIPGEKFNISEAKLNDDGKTSTSTVLLKDTPLALQEEIYAQLESKIVAIDGSIIKSTNTIDKTQLVFESLQLDLNKLDMHEDGLGSFEVDGNNLYMIQDSGKFLVGRIVPVDFTNKQGLRPEGDNLYSATLESGDPIATKTDNIGNKILEISNADLSESLVNLMVFQRSYEANSKSITTSDEFLKTAINLKK